MLKGWFYGFLLPGFEYRVGHVFYLPCACIYLYPNFAHRLRLC